MERCWAEALGREECRGVVGCCCRPSRHGELQLLVDGGGGEAVWREVCRGVEQDGEGGKPDGANGRGVGGANTSRSQLDAEGYLQETGPQGCELDVLVAEEARR